ncbi:MAG: hypothetical protein N3A68_08140 [Bacteroidia bacterium]|jgi:hypothetical protein|nr:hypothetical protein [Bacteroidia bacterium]GIV22776.1 MAG: hypothetical protein KatS3mg025_0435 [Bacteroidia bacterium]
MNTRVGAFLLGIVILGAGWKAGEAYYAFLQTRNKWYITGQGLLWDSLWISRQIEAIESSTQQERLWLFCQEMHKMQLFRKINVYYTGKGEVCIEGILREPVARVALPMRQYYVDREGARLPCVRSLDLPIIEAHKWDSTAIATFLGWWEKKPWYHRAVSRLKELPDGQWIGFLEVAPEIFWLGRVPHLDIALQQWDVYLRSLQPKVGIQYCKNVILFIPNQIICQN